MSGITAKSQFEVLGEIYLSNFNIRLMDSTLSNLLSVFFPEEISCHFEVSEVMEYKEYIEIVFKECKDLVPEHLKGSPDVVLDGYCNALQLQSFPLKGKGVYLKLYRRRWKRRGAKEHYSNTYDLHPEGVKATKEFAAFLKGSYGQSTDQYNDSIKMFMH